MNIPLSLPPHQIEALRACVIAWKEFGTKIENDQPIGVIYHADFDGLVGACYIQSILVREYNSSVVLMPVPTEDYDFDPLLAWLERTALAYCVCVDISLVNQAKVVNALSRFVPRDVFVFDHHQRISDVPIPSNIYVTNPTPTSLNPGERPIPTFLFISVIAGQYNIEFPKWLLITSLFCEGVDSFFEADIRALYLQVFGAPLTVSPRAAFRGSAMADICTLTRAGFVDAQDTEALERIYLSIATGQITSISELCEKLAVFRPSADAIRSEISSYVEEWEYRIGMNDNEPVILVPIESRFDIAGPVASILRGKFPDRIIVSYRHHRDVTILELRTRNDTFLNLAQIVSSIAAHTPVINCGGHPPAAGVLIKTSSFERYLIELLEALRYSLRRTK